ncbi:ankyrin repeat domain-containing protein [bacterium]|nr:ankyrin repeat domain-containing protein [candidate division CSSED10-310 bacterium]
MRFPKSAYVPFILILAVICCGVGYSESRELQQIRSLIEKDPSAINRTDNRSRTPLHIAAEKGQIDVVAYLIEKGADLEAADFHRNTPLTLAVEKGNLDVVRLLAESGAKMKGPGIDSVILNRALASRSIEMLKYLLQQGLDPAQKDTAGNTVLHYAARYGLEQTRIILESGVDVNAVNHRGETPLFNAFLHPEIVDCLIEAGADVNVKSAEGTTPLLKAIQSMQQDSRHVWSLIRAGADIRSKVDMNGLNALHFAVIHNRTDVIEYLLKQGFDVNVRDKRGYTPLFYASRRETMELLLKNGADINAVSDEGLTPVHLAAGRDSADTLEMLVARGAKLNVVSKNRETPMDYAMRHGSEATKTFLREHGSKEGPKDTQKHRQETYQAMLLRKMMSPDFELSGKVLDVNGDPVSDVDMTLEIRRFQLENLQTDSTTDTQRIDGAFHASVPSASDIIMTFKKQGYRTATVQVGIDQLMEKIEADLPDPEKYKQDDAALAQAQYEKFKDLKYENRRMVIIMEKTGSGDLRYQDRRITIKLDKNNMQRPVCLDTDPEAPADFTALLKFEPLFQKYHVYFQFPEDCGIIVQNHGSTDALHKITLAPETGYSEYFHVTDERFNSFPCEFTMKLPRGRYAKGYLSFHLPTSDPEGYVTIQQYAVQTDGSRNLLAFRE